MLFGELKEKFVAEVLPILTATTPEEYHAAQHQFKLFLSNEVLSVDVSSWLDWWHDRGKLIFSAFTLKESPSNNLAEVIHAGWKNQNRMGISLLYVFFYIRDSLLESLLCRLDNGSFVIGYGPIQGLLNTIRLDKKCKNDRKNWSGYCWLWHIRECRKSKHLLFTNQKNGRNLRKQKINSDEGLQLKRMSTATAESMKLKVQNMKGTNLQRQNILFPAVWIPKKSYTVQICLSPSSSCPDFQKNSLRVFCKHILFLLRYVLRNDKSSELLKTRYFSNDDVKVWFYNNQLNAIDQQYVQKVEKSSHNKCNLQEILSNHTLHNHPQKVRFMHKANRSVKCHGQCYKATIIVGTRYLKVKSSLIVPHNPNDALLQDFYFCSQKIGL